MDRFGSSTYENNCLKLLKYEEKYTTAATLAEKQHAVKCIQDILNFMASQYKYKLNSESLKNRVSAVNNYMNNVPDAVYSKNMKKLIKVYEAMNSSKSEYSKISEITEVFKDDKDLFSEYYELIPVLFGTPFIDALVKATSLLKNNKDKVKDIKVLTANGNLENVLEYSRFIAEEFINFVCDDSSIKYNNLVDKKIATYYKYNIDDFYKKYGINKDIFDYCVNTVLAQLDVDLYNKCLYEMDILEQNFAQLVVESIDDIHERIMENDSFTDIEFLKMNPLRNISVFTSNYPKQAEKYVKKAAEYNAKADKAEIDNHSEKSAELIEQEKKNAFINDYLVKIANIKTYISTKPNSILKNINGTDSKEYLLNDYLKTQSILVSQSELNLILAYMRHYKLPFDVYVFNTMANNYVDCIQRGIYVKDLNLTSLQSEDFMSADEKNHIIIPSEGISKKRSM